MEIRLLVKYCKEVARAGILAATVVSGDGVFQERISAVIITHTPELNQSKQRDTYNHAVYTAEMVYLERPGHGYWN